MDFAVLLFAFFDFCALLVSFLSLCIVCDEHLVPAVEVFIVQFEVPEEVAAVTLVAFGSAAPELFLNSVSAVAKTSDLSMAAILGSGIIAFGLIPPLCILSAPQAQIKLKLYPIIRECTFYLIGLFVFLGSIKDGRLASYEAVCLILVYLCYTGIVAIMYFRSKAAAEAAEARAAENSAEMVPLSQDIDREGGQLSNSGKGSSPINKITQGTNSPMPSNRITNIPPVTANSPSNDRESCRFFPTLSRSTSDLTRMRRSSRNNNSTQGRSDSPSSNRTNGISISTARQQTNGALDDVEISTSEAAALLTGEADFAGMVPDDVESVAADIDMSSGSVGVAAGTNQDGALHNVGVRAFHSIYAPIQHVIRSLLPALHPNIPHFISGNNAAMSVNRNPVVGGSHVSLRRAVLVLACCIVAIGVMAVLIVLFCESVIAQMGFSSTAMGATLVALGAEIPDAVSAVALARNGYYNAAMAGAIGSQVINVTLGVGVPALLVCLFGDGFLRISQPQTASLVLLTCLLIVVILSYITVTVPIAKMIMQRRWANNTIVSKPGAAFQVLVWGLTYVTFLHFNKDDPVIPAPL